MKSIILALLLTGAGALSAKAQSTKFFVEAGLSESTFSPAGSSNFGTQTNNYSYSLKTGFHGGIGAEFSFGQFSLDPSVQYSQRGGNVHITSNIPSGSAYIVDDVHQTINYLEVPINVLYHFHSHGSVSFFVGGGPYVGYGLSGKTSGLAIITQTIGSTQTTTQSSGTTTDTFGTSSEDDRQFVYGANAVLGVAFAKNIRASVDYLFDISGPFNNSSPKIHDNTFKVTLGYAFH